MSCNKWKEYRLEELCRYRKQKISIEKIDFNNYISTENMLQDKKGITIASNIPKSKNVDKYLKNDILISNIRPYFKKIWYANKDGGASSDVLIFYNIDDNILNNKYLYYLLSSDDFFNYVMSTSKGTKMPRGDKDAIMKYKINLPSLQEQEKIANVLSCLDNKIELNNDINKTLEEIAQSIFKRWFVDFEFPNKDGEPYKSSGGEMVQSEIGMIPKFWNYGVMNDLCEKIYSGGTPKTSEESYWNGNIPWMSSGETKNSFIIDTEKYITKLGSERSSTKFANRLNTVIASAGQGFTRGQTSLLLINTYINQSLITLKPKQGYEFFNYINIKGRYNELRNISDSHSIRGSLTTKMISKLGTIMPCNDILERFSLIMEPIIL